MNLATLSFAYVRSQPLNTLLTLLLLTLGVGTIVVVLLLNAQFKQRMQRDVAGIDLVVGAKGSPLQLILSSVYHIDIPTGNIPFDQAEAIAQHPLVAGMIPLALGDAVRGYRIVGTRHEYLTHYGAELRAGELWQEPLEVVLGAEVALRAGFGLGDSFTGQHGLAGESLLGHDEHPYRVVGILKPTATTLDRLVLTAIESVQKVHENHAGASTGATTPQQEITALLIKYRSPLAAVTLPRLINAQTTLQAAPPAFEIARLFNLIGVGIEVLRGFAYLLIGVAALSIFVALYGTLRRRRFDIAVMRSLGASRMKVLCFVLAEGLLISLGGTVLGILFGHLATEAVATWLRHSRQIFLSGIAWLPEEVYLLLLALLVGMVAALIPALRAYRLDIARVLVER